MSHICNMTYCGMTQPAASMSKSNLWTFAWPPSTHLFSHPLWRLCVYHSLQQVCQSHFPTRQAMQMSPSLPNQHTNTMEFSKPTRKEKTPQLDEFYFLSRFAPLLPEIHKTHAPTNVIGFNIPFPYLHRHMRFTLDHIWRDWLGPKVSMSMHDKISEESLLRL